MLPRSRDLLALVMVVLVSACTTAVVRPSVVTLTATGVELTGDRATDRRWVGLAVALEDGQLLCPASLLTLAARADASGPTGDPVPANAPAVRMLDRARDLAILEYTSGSRSGVTLAPLEPSSAESRDGIVVELRATSEARSPVERTLSHTADAERLHLSANASPGSPYFDLQGRLLGFVGHDGLSVLRVGSIVRRDRGTPLSGLYSSSSLDGVFAPVLTRKTCLKPGEAFRMPVADSSDVAIEVVPVEPGFLSSAFVRGPVVTWKGAVDGATLLAFAGHRPTATDGTTPRHAAAMLLVNPARATREACATLRIGTFAWERRLGDRKVSQPGVGSASAASFEDDSRVSSLSRTRHGGGRQP